jgi:hypothetical protein
MAVTMIVSTTLRVRARDMGGREFSYVPAPGNHATHCHPMGKKLARPALGCAVVLVLFAFSAPASAEPGHPESTPEYARARAAYDRAIIAYRKGDYAQAASEYDQADRLVPSRQALESALDAALLADEPVLGVELVERSARAPVNGRLATLVAKAREQFAHRTGRLRIECIPDRPCLATLDGKAIDTKAPLPVRVGPHTVALQVDHVIVPRLIEVKADDEVKIPFPASAPASNATPARPIVLVKPPAPPPPPSPSGVSPGWFYAGLGLTAVVAGGTIVSAIDTRTKFQQFEADGCRQIWSSTCDQRAGDGEAAELRTNIMIGVNAALGVATAVTGLFFVRWRQSPAKVSVGVTHGGALATLRVPL